MHAELHISSCQCVAISRMLGRNAPIFLSVLRIFGESYFTMMMWFHGVSALLWTTFFSFYFSWITLGSSLFPITGIGLLLFLRVVGSMLPISRFFIEAWKSHTGWWSFFTNLVFSFNLFYLFFQVFSFFFVFKPFVLFALVFCGLCESCVLCLCCLNLIYDY